MLNDWCELPDDASRAVRRAAPESSREASTTAETIVEGSDARPSPAPAEDDRRADRGAHANAAVTVTETDLLYWFG